MQGMIDYLTGPSSGARVLRQQFIFKVVPMLNPDGVINGNTRVSLAGWDLNRKWSNPIEQLFPTIYHLKRQLAHFQTRGRVAIYCDLHGHSINRNIFTYGCCPKKKNTSSEESRSSAVAAAAAAVAAQTSPATSESTSPTATTSVKTDPRVFPMIVARHAPCFSFASCDFSIHKSKVTTARVVVHQELGVTNSYTLEASFCGPDFGVRKDTQFSTWDLQEMGRAWCQSLLVYYGLTYQVRKLDERDREQAADIQHPQYSVAKHAANLQNQLGTFDNSQIEEDDSSLARDLLLDCEAAISALFSHSDLNANEGDGSDDDLNGAAMDSDLSGAEEEPIPPSPDYEDVVDTEGIQHAQSERKKLQDDDVDATPDEGYSSAPEDFPSRKSKSTAGSHRRKKAAKRRHTRGASSSKSKPASTTARKGEGKSKKKKKRNGKPELHRPSLPPSIPLMGPKPEDTTVSADRPPILVKPPADAEPPNKSSSKRLSANRPAKGKSGRPRTSHEVPKFSARAVAHDKVDVELVPRRASLRLCPMPEHPNTPNTTLLVLPSVVDRSIGMVPRVLKTAPAYDPEYPALEEKVRFSLSRVRSELPALQLSGRDEEQQRQARLRQLWKQPNDDLKSDEDSDASSGRSEPETNLMNF